MARMTNPTCPDTLQEDRPHFHRKPVISTKKDRKSLLIFAPIGVSYESTEEQSSRRRERTTAIRGVEKEPARVPETQLTRGPATEPGGTQVTGCRRMARESSYSERCDGKHGKRGPSPQLPEGFEVTISCDSEAEPDLRQIGQVRGGLSQERSPLTHLQPPALRIPYCRAIAMRTASSGFTR